MTERDGQLEGDTLAEKLEHLFRTVRDDRGREYSLEDVAQAIAERGGPTISATYIWQLRKGTRSNPRMSHLEALAAHFGVDPAYFFPGQLRDDLVDAALLRDTGARALAAQAAGLPQNTQALLVEVAQLARAAHGLPNPASA